MSHDHKIVRRKFLGTTLLGCASLSVTPLYSGITNLGLMNAAAAANRPLSSANNYKALVCVMLRGGNDSFNMLVPRGQSEYTEYAGARGNLAIPQADLLPINPTNVSGINLGLHPQMSNVQNFV